MAEEGEEIPYKITYEDGTESASSRDFNGKGTAQYPNGDIYEGFYAQGLRAGHGIYKYANGDSYEGAWANNDKHGIGKMKYNAGGEYHGYFENGKKHGEGVFTYPNKDIYSGWWRYGKKDGQGTYIFSATQMKFVGTWKEGEMNEGKWIYPNGNYFEGKFEQNKPTGAGVWYFKNGNQVNGEYVQKQITTEDEEEAEDAKPKVEVIWNSDSNLYSSALEVNSLLS
mmetsp:Transcript_35923/g.40863  ORF Transcript_35923/g.40863 Transcript_35923/m.40863 type:complete len:225 (+) Transcript_35923:44-718(+)